MENWKKEEKQEKKEQLLTCNKRGWCFWFVFVFPSNFFASPDPISMEPFSAVSLFSSACMNDKYIRKNIEDKKVHLFMRTQYAIAVPAWKEYGNTEQKNITD